ncbi:MAG: hypothetical protein J5783_01820 [Lachnospiraceae bacterium]|nr:hypothetical protein [Lachnospiraceae bacterium]
MSEGDKEMVRLIKLIAIAALAIIVVIVGFMIVYNYIKKKNLEPDPKYVNDPPEVIADIVHGNPRKVDSKVYVREGEEYVPYIVIKTDNYGENTVLLMREEVYPKEMMFRDCNIYGAGGSYYPGSVIDDFMENELFNMYSDSMKKIIKNTPIKIHTHEYCSKLIGPEYPVFETVYRHVFSLSLSECNDYDLYIDNDIEGAYISDVSEYPIKKYVWLRSDAYGGDDTWASQIFDGNVRSERISNSNENYIRPVFTVASDNQIKKIKNIINDIDGYIFTVDERGD